MAAPASNPPPAVSHPTLSLHLPRSNKKQAQAEHHQHVVPPAAARVGATHPRQPAPDGRAAAPEPPGAGAAARAGRDAAAGDGARRGGVVGRRGAGRAQDARRRLLQPSGHAGA